MRTRRVERARWAAALLSASILSVSCAAPAGTTTTSSASPATQTETTAASTTTGTPITTVPALVTTLPPCDDGPVIPASIGAGQVGFVEDGAVYVSDPDGGNLRCITEIGADGPLLWGPAGDRLVAGDAVITSAGSVPTVTNVEPTWSRPTGTSVVWVENGRLFKAGSDQSMTRDISFLVRHDEVTYHPAGFEIATTGEADDGTRGIWLSNNEGGDPRLIVRADLATPHEFTFTQDGVTAYFLADHGDHWHVHNIFLVLPEDNPGANEFDATIEYESRGPLSHIVVSPWDGWWAVQDGTCGSNSRLVLPAETSLPDEIAEVDAYPVGWLPNLKLVVSAYPNGCDQAADIWVVDVVPGGDSSATLLVAGVGAAAVRAAVPDPPQALGDVSLDEFA